MRLKATSFKDYSEKRGFQSSTNSPVWQFVCMDDTPFLRLLQPEDEVVEAEKKVSMFELAFQLEGQVGESAVSKQEVAVETSTDEDSVSFFPEAKADALPELNASVLGLGVSQAYAVKHSERLQGLKVPVFVYCDMRSKSLDEVRTFLTESVTTLTKMFYVLHISLKFSEQLELQGILKEFGYKNVRLIGDNVVKIDGSNFSGLFPVELVRHFSLEFNYKENVHPTTQVKLIQKTCSAVPIETLDYASAIKGISKSVKTSSKKATKSSSSEKKPVKPKAEKKVAPAKPVKKKLDRRSLFG